MLASYRFVSSNGCWCCGCSIATSPRSERGECGMSGWVFYSVIFWICPQSLSPSRCRESSGFARGLSAGRHSQLHRDHGIPDESLLKHASERIGDPRLPLSEPGESKNVVDDRIIRRVPLDGESLLAALGMLVKGAVGKSGAPVLL